MPMLRYKSLPRLPGELTRLGSTRWKKRYTKVHTRPYSGQSLSTARAMSRASNTRCTAGTTALMRKSAADLPGSELVESTGQQLDGGMSRLATPCYGGIAAIRRPTVLSRALECFRSAEL